MWLRRFIWGLITLYRRAKAVRPSLSFWRTSWKSLWNRRRRSGRLMRSPADIIKGCAIQFPPIRSHWASSPGKNEILVKCRDEEIKSYFVRRVAGRVPMLEIVRFGQCKLSFQRIDPPRFSFYWLTISWLLYWVGMETVDPARLDPPIWIWPQVSRSQSLSWRLRLSLQATEVTPIKLEIQSKALRGCS